MKFLDQYLKSSQQQQDPANENVDPSRRQFLVATGGASLGLMLGLPIRDAQSAVMGSSTTRTQQLNPFVWISPEGGVTVLSKHLDKGQGILSGLASLVADEMDAAWDQMSGDFAPSDPSQYNNLAFGPVQGTGGSTGISNSFTQYRQAGAAARAMLVQAAANAWQVPAAEITVSDGVIAHASGKRGHFGEFAAAAAMLPVPAEVSLKSPEAFKFVGKTGHGRLDSAAKSLGAIQFTQDVHLPGMLTAVIARAPKFGATLASVDDQAARKVRGVKDVVRIPQGVAVLATNTWAAMQGRQALVLEWDDSGAETRSTEELLATYRALAEQPGIIAIDDGDVDSSLAEAPTVLEAVFEFPFLAHAPMEPMNAVVNYQPGASLEIITGSQIQTIDHSIAAAMTGLGNDKITIKTLYSGGSFGRRANPTSDYVAEAIAIAQAIEGRAPVKLVWSREDDIQGGYYRPMYVHKVRAALDGEGNIAAFHHRIVGQSIVAGTPFAGMISEAGIDSTSIEGANELPYQLGSHKLEVHNTEVGVPPLWWRSVGSTHTAYVVETMMDRLAAAAGVDPLAFRLRNMSAHPRELGVLKLAAEKAGWGKQEPKAGMARGLAVHKSFGSYVAQVVDVRLDAEGKLSKVERVVCAVDCGLPVMPDQIKAQIEGGIGYGLGAALRNKITLTNGAVDQSQFHNYQPLRMSDMPTVETYIVPSDAPPTGVGEPGVPPIAPAVANALFSATGAEINALPMSDSGLV